MKKKITALLAIFILIFTNYAFAENGTSGNSTANLLKNIATGKDKNTIIDARYTAKSSSVSQSYDNYDYNSNNSCAKINITQNKPNYYERVDYKTTNKCYIKEIDGDGFLDRYLTIKINPSNIENFENLNILYKDGITYNGQKYDVKLQVMYLCDFNNSVHEICFHVGRYELIGDNKKPVGFLPGVGVIRDDSTDDRGRVAVRYIVQNSDGQEVPVNGIFVVSDIDLKQGIYLGDGIDLTKNKAYLNKDNEGNMTDSLYYIYNDEPSDKGTYIYTTDSSNIKNNLNHAYVTMHDSSNQFVEFEFSDLDAFSTIGYDITFENYYYKIETIVHNGKISDPMYDVAPNSNKTISYQPNDNYYLKEIKVNGDRKSLTESIQNSYTFPDINSDNEIEVTYAKKLKVEFDSKGGSEVPTQHVIPREKATEPANPQKEGYTFEGWYIDNDCTTPYNFDSEVTEDKILYAKWKEIPPVEITHNIRYVVKGTPNDNNATGNPTSYKEGDTNPLAISNPTLEGYTFSGWFEREDLIGNPISSLSVAGKTEDITLYGKWNKDPEPEPEEKTAQYKVNHYLEDENGTIEYNGKKYKLDEDNSTTKTGIVGTTVSETARNYAGYNKTKDSVQATILEDGSTTLDFYYNKIKYTITFDSKGGTKVDTQTKNYEEKVDEPDDPTKDGYKFLYWYEEKDGEKVIYDFDTPVTSDKTLIAEWEKIKIIPDNPEEDTDVTEQKEEVPAKKTDTTTATKILPNTGIIGTALIGTLIVLLGAFFGIRYFKIRKDMK